MNIDRIIKDYSAKRKVLLLTDNNLSETLYSKPLFTPPEHKRILDSINKEKDILQYNQLIKKTSAFYNYMYLLKAQFYQVRHHYNTLGALSMQALIYMNTGELLTEILKEITDPKTQNTIKKIITERNFIYAGALIEIKSSNLVKLNIDNLEGKKNFKDTPLLKSINKKRESIRNSLILLKTYIEAGDTFIENNKLNLRTYDRYIKDIKREIKTRQDSMTIGEGLSIETHYGDDRNEIIKTLEVIGSITTGIIWETLSVLGSQLEAVYTDLFGHLKDND